MRKIFQEFVSAHDFYLYAKPEGLDIEIPIDRITDAIVSKPVDGDIKVKEQIYYSSYTVQYSKAEPTNKNWKRDKFSSKSGRKKVFNKLQTQWYAFRIYKGRFPFFGCS